MTTRTSADSKLLLFVCTGNFYRSRHAEALFNWHAERHGLAARAFSRGLLTSLWLLLQAQARPARPHTRWLAGLRACLLH